MDMRTDFENPYVRGKSLEELVDDLCAPVAEPDSPVGHAIRAAIQVRLAERREAEVGAYPAVAIQVRLEPEQEQLFSRLVEAVRSVPRDQRQDFSFGDFGRSAAVKGNGLAEEVLGSDIRHLQSVGLIAASRYHRNSEGFDFYIPPDGFDHYESLKAEAVERVAQIEAEVRSYLDAAGFRDHYPGAYARWREAERLLWGADSDREHSTIGHKCREAVQEFATALVERFNPPSVNPNPAMTRDRLSAIVELRRPEVGERVSTLLDALFGYWQALGNLVQRQVHDGQRERERLTWQDSRRVVFQTALVMFELDQALR